MGSGCLARRGQSHADGAYDATPAAHDYRSAFDLVGRTSDHSLADAMGTAERPWQTPRKPSVVLARLCCRADRMACAGDVPIGHAIANMAFHRTRLLSHDRSPVLVARDSALARSRTMAPVVDASLSLPGDSAVRCSFRLARFLRSCRVPHVSVYARDGAANGRPFSSRRSAMRGGVDVDLRDGCLLGGRDDSFDADTRAEI